MIRPSSRTRRGARPSDGSSISTTSGLPTSARPHASMACSPPESLPPRCCRRSRRRGKRSSTRERFHPRPLPRRSPTTRCSRTSSDAKTRRPCGTRPTPRRAISCAARPVTSKPFSTTAPRRTGIRPPMARMSVVLPTPLRPSTVATCPCPTCNDTPWRIMLSPYPAWTSRTSSIVGPQVDLGHAGVLADLRLCALSEHTALVEDDDALGQRQRDVHVVLDEQERHVAREAVDHGGHRGGLGRRQAGRRLVEQQDARPRGERQDQLELPLLAVGEVARRHVAPVAEAPLVEELLSAPHDVGIGRRRPVQREARAIGALDGEQHVVEHGELREERRDLEGPAEAQARAAKRLKARDVTVEERDAAAVRADETGEDRKSTRLNSSHLVMS